MVHLAHILLYTTIPFIASLVGGSVGSFYTPKRKVVSTLQHFVAGILIGSVAIELLPKILGTERPFFTSIGFIVGVIAMLLIEKAAHNLMHQKGAGLLFGACIDLFVDGLLIGVAFLAGLKGGVMIAISLSFCAFFLSMTVMTVLKRPPLLLLLAIMLPCGALLGGWLTQGMLEEAISFGVAALLYLGVEEFLAHAHKNEDNVWISATFFVGFFCVYLFSI